MAGRYILVDEDFQQQMLRELSEIKQLIALTPNKEKQKSDDLMDTADTMAYLKSSRRTLYKYRQKGMPYKQMENGKIYYRKYEIDQFLSNPMN
jgi:ACT domain-containing protein